MRQPKESFGKEKAAALCPHRVNGGYGGGIYSGDWIDPAALCRS
jgi:hypothetical protein